MPDLKEKVDGHHATLFGPDGLTGVAGAKGLVNEISKKVSTVCSEFHICVKSKLTPTRFYVVLGCMVVALFTASSPFIFRAMATHDLLKSQTAENKSEIINFTKYFKKHEEVHAGITYQFKKIDKELQQIREMQMSKDDFREILRETIKEINKEPGL